MPEKSFCPWSETLYIPPYWKILFTSPVCLQGPNFPRMGECKMSHSRDWKSFPSLGNVKSFLPGTGRLFRHGEMWKTLGGGRKNVPVLTAGISFIGNAIFQWEAKTNLVFLTRYRVLLFNSISSLKTEKLKTLLKTETFYKLSSTQNFGAFPLIYHICLQYFIRLISLFLLDSPYGFLWVRKLQSRKDTYTLHT